MQAEEQLSTSDGAEPAADLTLEKSSALYFTYPFTFDRRDLGDLAERTREATGQQWGARDPAALWEPDNLRSVRDYLLPHLGDHLNPEANDDRDLTAAGYLWSLSQSARGLFNKAEALLDHEHADGRGASGFVTWRLELPHNEPITFRIADASLALFSAGVGVLTLQITPNSDKLVDWIDFAYHFSKRRGAHLTVTRSGTYGSADQVIRPDVTDVIHELLRTCAPPPNPGASSTSRWWRQIFAPGQFVPFPTLFVKERLDTEAINLIACRLRFGFSGQQAIEPSHWQLSDDAGETMHYSEQSLFVFSIDAAGFVACAAPRDDFWSHTLPNHLRHHYLLVLVLVLAQRTALMKISAQVAEDWRGANGEREQRNAFARINDDVLEYTARMQFPQVFHTEHYHACYQRYRRAFRVDDLYRDVRDSVAAMAAQLENAAARRREKETTDFQFFVFLITFVLLPAQLCLTLFGARIAHWPGFRSLSPTTTLAFTVVAIFVGIMLAIGVSKWRRHRRESVAPGSIT